jgi:hypothetical protein
MCNSTPNTLLSNWMDILTYPAIFRALQGPASDPQVLLVSGILTSSGQFQSASYDYIKNGTASVGSSTGDFSISVLDSTGTTLYQVTEQPQFSLFLDPLPGVVADNVTTGQVPVNSIPVTLSLPYSANASQVEIIFQKKTIASVSPNSQLLITSIEGIPSTSFKRDPDGSEKILLAQAENIDKQLMQCQKETAAHEGDAQISCINGAILSTLGLRQEIDLLLNSSTITSNPLQVTKLQVLATVDSVVLHLLPTMNVSGHHHSFRIWVLPPVNENDRGEFSVQSITQGENGTTALNKDGSVTYKPIGNPQADSFTVTLQDQEGTTVVRTVNITAPPKNCDEHGRDFDYFGRWGS